MIKKWIVLILILSGCTFEHRKGATGSESGSGGLDKTCTVIDFAMVQEQIFGKPGSTGRCISCHGPGGSSFSLQTYSEIRPRLAQIEDAVRSNRMPKNAPLDGDSKSLLFTWIQRGAPETVSADQAIETCSSTDGDSSTGEPPKNNALRPNFASLNASIFSVRCLSCHDSSGIFSSYDFSSYDEMMNYKKLFKIPDEGGDSRFVKSLVTGRMPQNSAPLSSEQIAVIREWVALGMPEFEGDVVGAPSEPPPVNPPAGPVVSCVDYEFVRAQIFEQRCVGCHGTKGGVNLETFASVKNHLKAIEFVVKTDMMPPKKALEPELKKYLAEWIANGAPEKRPENANCEPTITPSLSNF